MDELIYPARQRCRACRKYFGFIVVKGLFCSWECAGMLPPSRDPAHWPREHYTIREGRPREKVMFFSLAEAEDEATQGMNAYACGYCGGWHVGHPPKVRAVTGLSDTGTKGTLP